MQNKEIFLLSCGTSLEVYKKSNLCDQIKLECMKFCVKRNNVFSLPGSLSFRCIPGRSQARGGKRNHIKGGDPHRNED